MTAAIGAGGGLRRLGGRGQEIHWASLTRGAVVFSASGPGGLCRGSRRGVPTWGLGDQTAVSGPALRVTGVPERATASSEEPRAPPPALPFGHVPWLLLPSPEVAVPGVPFSWEMPAGSDR